MENVKEILKQAIELQKLAICRARELFMVRGGRRSSFAGIEFEENKVTVQLEEITRSDVPDRAWISLYISQLEMTENEWAEFLLEVKTEYLAEIQKINDKAAIVKLEAKQKEFERLKKELGL